MTDLGPPVPPDPQPGATHRDQLLALVADAYSADAADAATADFAERAVSLAR